MRRRPPNGRTIGIDIGGANLKYVCTDGRAASYSFAMWKRSSELASTLAEHLAEFSPADSWAVTMTGELADCFVDRRAGVEFIVDAANQAAETFSRAIRAVQPRADKPDLVFYGVDGRFYPAVHAKASFEWIAASNWHALASQVASTIVPEGVLIDIGSTTTDIIPLARGRVATESKSDYDRLVEQSLVYIGCRRTPVCGLVRNLLFQSENRVTASRVMNECFATIDDARLVLGIEPESPLDLDTSDGGPRTIQRAANRLARMIGRDQTNVSIGEARSLASQILDAARQEVRTAFEAIDSRGGTIVLSGHGHDLFDIPEGRSVVDLAIELGAEISRCRAAWAVAQLRSGSRGIASEGAQTERRLAGIETCDES